MTTDAIKLADVKLKDEYQTLRPLTPLESEHLKHSIKKFGVKVPIDLNEKYEVIDGHHRTQISIALGLEHIPARIHNFSQESLTAHQFIYAANVPRRHLEDFEKVELASTMVSYDTEEKGRSRELIAAETGVSPATAARCVKIIAKGSDEVKQKLRTGKANIHEEYNKIHKQEKRQTLLAEAKKLDNNELFFDKSKLYLGDFREIELEPSSIDLIFTDPPYSKECLPVWENLAQLAARVLKPGASLVAMTGGYSLPQVIELFTKAGMQYNWFCYMKHTGATQAMHGNHVIASGKLILWFYKGDRLIDTGKYVSDFVQSQTPDKSLHDWAQSPVEAEHFIAPLTVDNQIVLDPFMGSGTTGIASLKLNRKFIGIEIDEERFNVAQARLSSYQPV